jgi:hypothetical protein
MINIFKEAKLNKQILHFENFQTPEITWEDAINFIYKESTIINNRLKENPGYGGSGKVYGNIQSMNGYLLPQTNNLFPVFKGVSEFMKKVNGGNSGENCFYYKNKPDSNEYLKCNCEEMWHIQALRFSISNHRVSNHNDPNDVLYWQLLGTSYWKMNNDKVYKLNPGDLFYFNKEDSHEVWQDGPRSGIIIDAIKQRY